MARLAQALQVGPRVRSTFGQGPDVVDLVSPNAQATRKARTAERLFGTDLGTQLDASLATQALGDTGCRPRFARPGAWPEPLRLPWHQRYIAIMMPNHMIEKPNAAPA